MYRVGTPFFGPRRWHAGTSLRRCPVEECLRGAWTHSIDFDAHTHGQRTERRRWSRRRSRSGWDEACRHLQEQLDIVRGSELRSPHLSTPRVRRKHPSSLPLALALALLLYRIITTFIRICLSLRLSTAQSRQCGTIADLSSIGREVSPCTLLSANPPILPFATLSVHHRQE